MATAPPIAGLVLGPGAFVTCRPGSVIVKILPKVGIKPLIFTGYIIFALAMWRYASIDLGTDLQTCGSRPVRSRDSGLPRWFVPVSQLAYSFLPKNKNNKASSLTNLFRNQGGSVVIAFVTNVLARRTQLITSLFWLLTPLHFHQRYQETLATLSRYFVTHGFYRPPDAALHAKAHWRE